MRRLRAAAICLLALLQACSERRLSFEVPEGFHGWVTVTFGNRTCSKGAVTATGSVIAVDTNGSGCTRVPRYPKTAWLRYYYVANGERTRELRSTGWSEGGMIWGQSTDLDGSVFRFFVGTEAEFKRDSSAQLHTR